MWNIVKILGEKKAGLMIQIPMAGFSGILGTGQVEDRKMMKGKLIAEKKL